jgi:hypothetical protein
VPRFPVLVEEIGEGAVEDIRTRGSEFREDAACPERAADLVVGGMEDDLLDRSAVGVVTSDLREVLVAVAFEDEGVEVATRRLGEIAEPLLEALVVSAEVSAERSMEERVPVEPLAPDLLAPALEIGAGRFGLVPWRHVPSPPPGEA